MGPELKQNQQLKQELKLTQQILQTLKLIQAGRQELIELIQQEIQQNPILEEKETFASKSIDSISIDDNEEDFTNDSFLSHYDKDFSFAPDGTENIKPVENKDSYDEYLNSRTEGTSFVGTPDEIAEDKDRRLSTQNVHKSLSEYLLEQLALFDLSEKDREIAYHIIMNLDENGYFKGESEEENLVNLIAIQARALDEDILRVLKIVQTFDPPGVGARDLKECLIIQARHYNCDNEILIKAIEEHLTNFERKKYPEIAKALNITENQVREIEETIRMFNPKPGASISGHQSEYIIPDIEVYKSNGDFKVRLIKDNIPKIGINQQYLNIMRKRGRDPNSRYIRDKYRSAKIFITALNERELRLKQVAEIIVKKQREFFEKGEGYLKPLQEKEIANELKMNVSTMSRIFNSKYMLTPHGVFPLKYFIKRAVISNEGENITNDNIKNMIKQMIDDEDPKYPLKDDEIVRRLSRLNINIKRRTVAKYRDALGIQPYNIRKRIKNPPK